jgi:hypothetical protein
MYNLFSPCSPCCGCHTTWPNTEEDWYVHNDTTNNITTYVEFWLLDGEEVVNKFPAYAYQHSPAYPNLYILYSANPFSLSGANVQIEDGKEYTVQTWAQYKQGGVATGPLVLKKEEVRKLYCFGSLQVNVKLQCEYEVGLSVNKYPASNILIELIQDDEVISSKVGLDYKMPNGSSNHNQASVVLDIPEPGDYKIRLSHPDWLTQTYDVEFLEGSGTPNIVNYEIKGDVFSTTTSSNVLSWLR